MPAARKKIRPNIKNRHALFVEIIGQLAVKSWHEWVKIGKEADVSPQTLNNWVFGETVSPLTRTLFNVAEALGYQLKWEYVKKKGRPRIYRVK